MLFNLLATAGGNPAQEPWVTWVFLGILGLAVIGLFAYRTFSKKKSQENSENQKNSLNPGDKIMTVGGIVGTIVEVLSLDKGKEIIIETGSEDRKTTMTLDISAIYIITERGELSKAAMELAAQKKADEEAERLAAKNAKKNK